jgi:hypothetical protein
VITARTARSSFSKKSDRLVAEHVDCRSAIQLIG